MIEVSHLTKRYGNHAAVADLSFTAEKGKIYGFLGPNGAGKSTTMNMMTGYLAPSAGTVRIDDFDIMKQPEDAKARIGYLPEVPPVYPDMTVREYLEFTAELKKIPKKERTAAVDQAMKKTEVLEVQSRLIKNLSKGYKQRVGLAQAIINNPAIIILDEPTSGLDPEQQREMFDYIRSLKEEHTIILSSHILSDVSAVCDYIWIINHGQMVASDTPEGLSAKMTTTQEICVTVLGSQDALEKALQTVSNKKSVSFTNTLAEDGSENVTAVIETDKQEDIRPAVSQAIFGAGLTVLSMSRKEKSLEDIFLTLTGDAAKDNVNAESRADSEENPENKFAETKYPENASDSDSSEESADNIRHDDVNEDGVSDCKDDHAKCSQAQTDSAEDTVSSEKSDHE